MNSFYISMLTTDDGLCNKDKKQHTFNQWDETLKSLGFLINLTSV